MFHKRSSLCFVQHNEDGALAARQVRIGDLRPTCSEGLLSAQMQPSVLRAASVTSGSKPALCIKRTNNIPYKPRPVNP